MKVKSTELIEIALPSTKSEIVRNNKNKLFCSLYKGLKGIFKKDDEKSRNFGRKICDEVKRNLNNQGFFTSDELPGYGMSQKEVDTINSKLSISDNDLIIFFSYNKEESQKTKNVLDKLLEENLK